jgi:hypothetical protein
LALSSTNYQLNQLFSSSYLKYNPLSLHPSTSNASCSQNVSSQCSWSELLFINFFWQNLVLNFSHLVNIRVAVSLFGLNYFHSVFFIYSFDCSIYYG